jgi:DNA-binding NtrC family response regulator
VSAFSRTGVWKRKCIGEGVETIMQPTQATSNTEAKIFPDLSLTGKTLAGILVVEDEEFVREAASEILESCGYRVFKACSFEDAVQTFQRNSDHVELLVSDIVIPGRNGRELVKALREFSPGLKVLYISGYSENVVTRQAALDGNSHYVAKPFSLRSLLEAIEIALEGGTIALPKIAAPKIAAGNAEVKVRRASSNG